MEGVRRPGRFGPRAQRCIRAAEEPAHLTDEERVGTSLGVRFLLSAHAAFGRRCQASTIWRTVSSSDWVMSHAG